MRAPRPFLRHAVSGDIERVSVAVKEILAQRGDHPGLVCNLSTMEPCSTYKLWHNKQTGNTYPLPDDANPSWSPV